MTAPEALPGLDDPAVGKGPAGRVEAAVSESIAAARLGPLDRGAGALAVELARAVDVGSRRRDPFAVAQAAGPLREQLMRLRLDPAAREGVGDAFEDWLRKLDDDDDTADPAAAVPHRPDA